MPDTPTTPTVPMFSPDGSLGDIPYEKMHDALQAGFKMGVNMLSSEGKTGVIPADRTQDAVKGGMKVVPYHLDDADGEKPGFWSAFGGDISKGVSALLSTPLQALKSNPDASGIELDPRSAAAHRATTEGLAAAQQIAKEDTARNNAGYGPAYRAIAPLAGATGIANVAGSEESAAKGDTGGVLGHAVASAAPLVIGETARIAIPKIAKALPNTESAGAALQEVKGAAGQVPMNMSKIGDTALELYTQSDRGASLPMAVRKLLNRATKPDSPPLTYAEAKDFQSNISRLSVDEMKRLNPNTKRLVGQLNSDLKAGLADAADVVGKRDQFMSGMREYYHAMKIKGFTDTAIDLAWKGALGAMGIKAAKTLYDKL